MNSTHDTPMKSINELAKEMLGLTIKHRGSPIMQRIQAYITQKTATETKPGLKLTEYLGQTAGVSDHEKAGLLTELISIVTAEEWDKLPQVAGGQASSAPVITPPPAPPKPVNPPLIKPAAAAPAAAPITEVKVTTQREQPAPLLETAAIKQPEGDEVLTHLMATIQALKNRPAPVPAAPAITEEQIRTMVRSELAIALQSIAEALVKSAS